MREYVSGENQSERKEKESESQYNPNFKWCVAWHAAHPHLFSRCTFQRCAGAQVGLVGGLGSLLGKRGETRRETSEEQTKKQKTKTPGARSDREPWMLGSFSVSESDTIHTR